MIALTLAALFGLAMLAAWATSTLTLPLLLGAGAITLAAQVCAFVYTLTKESQQ